MSDAVFSEIIHQPVRLKIMATLHALPPDELLEFVRLKAIVGATEGNLGAHLATLERAALLVVEKDFIGRKPRTRVMLSGLGREAFAAHVRHLQMLLGGAL